MEHMLTSELDRIIDEQPDFLIEDEDGLYLPTDDEIDLFMQNEERLVH